MKRALAIVAFVAGAAALLGIGILARSAWAVDDGIVPIGRAHHAYRLDVKLIELLPNGASRVSGSPTVVTTEGTRAEIQVGKTLIEKIDDRRAVEVPLGIQCALTPYRLAEGGVKVDVQIQWTEAGGGMNEEVVAETFGVRRIEQIPLGVKVEFPVKRFRGKPTHLVEVTVNEKPLRAAVRDTVPPPPRIDTLRPVTPIRR